MATTTSDPRAVGLDETCRRLGISRRTGERLLAEGRFPVPELPPLWPKGRRLKRRHRFSTANINRYLDTAATRGVA